MLSDAPSVHFRNRPFIANVSACSPAIVIQTPGNPSEPVGLSSSSGTGTFYSDAACTCYGDHAGNHFCNSPAAGDVLLQESTVGTPTITVTDLGTAGPKPNTQPETISNTAIATTIALTVVVLHRPSSAVNHGYR